MSTRAWYGTAESVAQVDTITVGGTLEATDILTVTVGTKAVETVAGSTNTTTAAGTVVTALSALDSSLYPEFAEITWTDNEDATISATAATEGIPFTATTSTTETGGGAADDQTFTTANATANNGPNLFGTAANWTGSTAPVNTDDVVITNSDVDILYDLDQATLTLGSLTIKQDFTGDIGLPEWNENEYKEYRDTYLAVSATTVNIGQGTGSGSGRIKLDTGSVNTTLAVYNSGSPAEQALKSILWKGTGAGNVVNVLKGSLDVAALPGESATIATLRVGYTDNQASDSDVRCSDGVTLTNVEQSGGTLELASNTTLVEITGGTLTYTKGTPAAITIDGGTVKYLSTGTITTLTIGSDGTFDCSADMQARTVTNCTMYEGATINDPHGTLTITNGIDLVRCGLDEVSIDLGENYTLTKSAI